MQEQYIKELGENIDKIDKFLELSDDLNIKISEYYKGVLEGKREATINIYKYLKNQE